MCDDLPISEWEALLEDGIDEPWAGGDSRLYSSAQADPQGGLGLGTAAVGAAGSVVRYSGMSLAAARRSVIPP